MPVTERRKPRLPLPCIARLLEERDPDLFAENALRLFWSVPAAQVVDLRQRRRGRPARERGWSKRM